MIFGCAPPYRHTCSAYLAFKFAKRFHSAGGIGHRYELFPKGPPAGTQDKGMGSAA